jgi:hypothetical protein
MKKIFIALLILSSTFCFAQSKSDITGTWKIIVKRSGLKNYTSPSGYTEFKDDGTYIWGIDSTNSDPLQSAAKGTWDLTDDGHLRLVEANNSNNEINYYKKSGDDRLKWDYNEINGKRNGVMLEMSLSLEKMK